MTRTAKCLAVGLTVIALASSFGTAVHAVEADGGVLQASHHSTSASSAGVMPTTENTTTDAATEDAESQSISTGVQITNSIDEGETKHYEFVAEEGRMIRIVHNDIANPANLTLYDPDGEPVARDTTHSKYRHPFGVMAEQSGTYTLEVRSEKATTYQFQVETRDPDYVASCGDAQGYESASNDDREMALGIYGNAVELTGILAESEEDWYAVDLEADERLDVTVSHRLAGPQDGTFAFDLGNGMQVDILDTNGRDIGQFDFPAKSTGSDWSEYDDATQTALADAPGTYYIRISNSSHVGGFAEYEMTVEVTEAES